MPESTTQVSRGVPLSPLLRFLPALPSLAKLAIDFILFCAASDLRSESCSFSFLRSLILLMASCRSAEQGKWATLPGSNKLELTSCCFLTPLNQPCGSVKRASSSFRFASAATSLSCSFSAFARMRAS